MSVIYLILVGSYFILGKQKPKETLWLGSGEVFFFSITKCNICLVSAPPLSPSGGLHHAAARIAGENVYKRLKHEGGTHRVQRIPEVGLSSRMQRIHTGTMTVIVLPQPEEVGPLPPPALSPLTWRYLSGRSPSAPSWTSTSTRRTFASTPSGPEAPGGRASTPQTARCESFTCPQVSGAGGQVVLRLLSV